MTIPLWPTCLSLILEGEGYPVETAVNGREALEIHAARPDTGLFVSDMNMPETNGLEQLPLGRVLLNLDTIDPMTLAKTIVLNIYDSVADQDHAEFGADVFQNTDIPRESIPLPRAVAAGPASASLPMV